MRTIIALLIGIAIAACAARAPSKSAAPAPQAVAPPEAAREPIAAGPTSDPSSELDRLDGQITAEMERLGIARPEPPPNACIAECEPQQMSTAVAAAAAKDPTCKQSPSQQCTEACTLADSICKNATRICDLASQLGGTDAYANDKCNRGTASCEAATKRCCSCM
jgi:hypothetical protein